MKPATLPRAHRVRRLMQMVPLLALSMVAGQATAAESGLTNYAHGALTVNAAMMPPPGKTQFYGYSQFYDAGSIRDNDGAAIPGLDAQAIAMAPRIVHTWETELGGFNLSSGVLAVLINLGIDTPFGKDYRNGPSLVGIEPLYLSRSIGAWHFLVGTVMYIPWGSYDPQRAANTTLNRYSGVLNGSVTWTPTPRWDVSLNYNYEIKGRNRDTQYRDGGQVGLTYGVTHRPFEDTRWDLGLGGYYTAQVEDDRQSGVTVPDRRIRKFVVGPKVGYWFNPATAVILQWHKEYAVRNAPRGDVYWLMFAFPLGS